jgi:hypothetical protein
MLSKGETAGEILFQKGAAKLSLISLGFAGAVFGGNTALSAETEPNMAYACWTSVTTGTTPHSGETTLKLCFEPDGKYTISLSACSEEHFKFKLPCEGWGGVLSYRLDGKSVELQTLESYAAAKEVYCKQDLSEFEQMKLVACIMPKVEWAKQPVTLEGK